VLFFLVFFTDGITRSVCYRLQSNAYAKLAKNFNKIVGLKEVRTKNEERLSRFSLYVSNIYEAWEEIRKFKHAKDFLNN
jgi:2-phosphoglycerate kinase